MEPWVTELEQDTGKTRGPVVPQPPLSSPSSPLSLSLISHSLCVSLLFSVEASSACSSA